MVRPSAATFCYILEVFVQITETKQVKREIYVAPCIACNNTDISLSDCGYSSFNIGGGYCKSCKREVNAGCGTFPTPDQLAAIWNSLNCVKTLIAAEEKKITDAKLRIAELSKI
jgi:hypothetical protein